MNTNVGHITVEYIKKFPDIPSKSLARLIANDFPEYFTIDKARDNVRYYRGNHGAKNKLVTNKTHPELVKENTVSYKTPLPPSKADKWDIATFNYPKTLILSDIHIPFHDFKALEAALTFGDTFAPDCILLNGDIMDCYSISKFIKDPRQRDFPKECDAINEFFAHLRERYPKAEIVWKHGNHEERYESHLFSQFPDMVNTRMWALEHRTEFEKYGVNIVKDKRIIKIGKLPIIHGHEFQQSPNNPVNAARGLFLRGIHSAIIGHFHHTSEHVQPDLLSKIISCWSVGCLAGLHPKWATINKWTHGFATVELSGYKFHVSNFRIYEGEIL